MPSVVHRTDRYANNRAEVSHQPTRERERQMRRFKSAAHAQRFLAVHGPIQNLFRVGRHLRCLARGDLRLKLKNGSSPHRGRSLPVQRQLDKAFITSESLIKFLTAIGNNPELHDKCGDGITAAQLIELGTAY
jgi:hypothetical protein